MFVQFESSKPSKLWKMLVAILILQSWAWTWMTALWVRHFVFNSIKIKFFIQEIISTICGFIFPMDLFINYQILCFEILILITFQVYPSVKHPYEVFLNYGFIDVANPTSQHQESRIHSPTYGNPGVNFTNEFFLLKFRAKLFCT